MTWLVVSVVVPVSVLVGGVKSLAGSSLAVSMDEHCLVVSTLNVLFAMAGGRLDGTELAVGLDLEPGVAEKSTFVSGLGVLPLPVPSPGLLLPTGW